MSNNPFIKTVTKCVIEENTAYVGNTSAEFRVWKRADPSTVTINIPSQYVDASTAREIAKILNEIAAVLEQQEV